MSKHTPVRDATSTAINTAILAFAGSLALSLINRALNEGLKILPEKPQQPDLHAVVD